MKQLNSGKIIGLYKEISYLRVESLRIEILERVSMIVCTFMRTAIGVFIYCFPIKKPRNLVYRVEI